MEPSMSNEWAVIPAAPISNQTRDFLAASKAPRTIRAYSSDLRDFEGWCQQHGLASLPATPETVADYISDRAASGIKPATITRRLSAISQAHKMADADSTSKNSPTQSQIVRMTAAGIRREYGTAQRQAKAISVEDLRAMIAALPDDLRGLRDRALLLLGFVGGMRRSELVGLDVDDVVEEREGLRVIFRRSKTDQEGKGQEIGILRGRHPLTDPVAALAEWREAAGIIGGPIFREVDRGDRVGSGRLSDRAVARIVKIAAERIGIDPATVSGHSLRAGLATSVAKAGATERMIMKTTRHRSEAMVRRYIQSGTIFEDSAGHFLTKL
jgi:site-specific recombinase XerD